MSFLVEKFLEYIKIDTTSNPENKSCPSSEIQWDLAKVIVKDLEAIGLIDISLDENGYIMGTLPSNTDKKIPTIGFIAHMDTAPSFNGTDVKPKIIENYDGNDIVLNKDLNVIMLTKDFPELKKYINQRLIVTDGTTLLGADDKAGIVEIMAALKYLKENPKIEHGDIKIGITPDEEIGRGANLFDVEKFGAEFAYTIDGGEIGELEFENFNAASAHIVIKGRDIHPGASKNKMINSMLLAMELNTMLPANERPEYTEGYEGFFLLTNFKGTIENTEIDYIIRDHSKEKFIEKKELMENTVKYLQSKYKDAEILLTLNDSYYNMREMIEPVYHIVDLARKAMLEVDVKPIIKPIRGGTDGARLSFKGLPCPNIFTGGHNFHGKFEFIPIESMEKAVKVILKIVEITSR
ncbi:MULTISPECIES: peptidase T [Cetobacterium]|uniref:Peptidase T n=1 Tax=Candidatus Cetobacterium colombiensis TaxID=3073100 RepID=A0ABU4W972_9FUSO|nr:peptidase T [Candidatus Cetobacterium colombiensis]MDX8335705.1 peptidase T [Candidatus Cetobacterium colombiensis]